MCLNSYFFYRCQVKDEDFNAFDGVSINILYNAKNVGKIHTCNFATVIKSKDLEHVLWTARAN